MRKFWSFLILFLLSQSIFAALKPLPADQAFQFSSQLQHNQMIMQWKMAPGYFLYRDKIQFKVKPTSQVKIGAVHLPEGQLRTDEIHGTYPVYFDELKVSVPLIIPALGQLEMEVDYQGCSAQGFCYPPVKKQLQWNLEEKMPTMAASTLSGQHYTNQLIQTNNYFLLMLIFFGLGLVLAFTPCVLPMVPILSSIIVGHHNKTDKSKAFSLSILYVLGMAFTYAMLGMAVAMMGSGFQGALQKPWVTVSVSVLFVFLAFWLLDFYNMHLPAHWQRKIAEWSHQQKSGSYWGVFLMGVLSTLIVSPCVSAPLVGVLAYIAQTGNILLGGAALLVMGFGMGVPLLLLGMSAGKWLPKSGPWMQMVQQLVAIVMLGMAIWMLSRLLPGTVILFLWGVLLIFMAFLLGLFSQAVSLKIIRRSLGLILLTYGLILMIGALKGNDDPLHPWENWKMESPKRTFITVKDMAQLDKQLAQAVSDKKIVLLDFYADWCTACVIMDKHVFNRPFVMQALRSIVLLRADVTANNDFDKQLLKRFSVIAPPTILFFDREGKELQDQRIVGEVNANEFLTHFQSEVMNANR